MNFVHLIQRVAHTVNNDVVRPLDRLVNPGNHTAPLAPKQNIPGLPAGNFNEAHRKIPLTVGPNFHRVAPAGEEVATPLLPGNLQNKMAIDFQSTPISKGVFTPEDQNTKDITNRASKDFKWTPEFKNIVNSAQAKAEPLSGQNNLANGAQAAAQYYPGFNNQYVNQQKIQIGKGWGSSPEAVTHEGLHAAWYKTPEKTKKDFAKVYDKTITPEIKDYLATRLQDYEGFQGRKSLDQKFTKLDPSIQTEVHSYLNGYPEGGGKRVGNHYQPSKLPPQLQKYYSRFINVNDALPNQFQRYQVLGELENLISPRLLQIQKAKAEGYE